MAWNLISELELVAGEVGETAEIQYHKLIRNLIIIATIAFGLLAASIVIGIVLGGEAKQSFVSVVTALETVYLAIIMLARLPIGGAAIGLAFLVLGVRPKKGIVLESIQTYLKSAAAIVASAIAFGYLLFLIPIENKPMNGFVVVSLAGLAMAHAIWREGGGWWPKVVGGVIVVMAGYILVSSFFPTLGSGKAKVIAEAPSASSPATSQPPPRRRREKDIFEIVENPRDPWILVRKIEEEGVGTLRVVVAPVNSAKTVTPYFYLPKCLGGQAMYDVVTKSRDTRMRWADQRGTMLGELNTGDYFGNGLPPVPYGGRMQIETTRSVWLIVECNERLG
ncbi:MAG: hypothetical protein G01um101429_764 [Parcubacteria group bacterium Gr01-1014_29]|nr:MAG: hypothetical protein G01um101429_764 [Parcubacteria group bacterium Gr01-1014_29]